MPGLDAKPSDVGIDAERLDYLRDFLRQDIDRGVSDGSIVLVARHGRIVMHEAIGYSDRESGRKARVDDVLPIMSLTKQHTAAVVMKWIERGEFALTTRAAEIIPEFGQKGKQGVTVLDLLTHRAGLPMQMPYEHFSRGIEEYVQVLCEIPYRPEPEEIVHYHAGAAHAVLAEMVRRCDSRKRTFRKILEDELYAPLGMLKSALTLLDRPDLKDRLVPQVMRSSGPDALSRDDVRRVAEICETVEFTGGGAYSTAYDQFRFAEMFRLGGALEGKRILSPSMVRLATTNQTGAKIHGLFKELCENENDRPFPAFIGLSLYVRGEGIFLTNMGTLMSPSGFAGSGYGGQLFAVDPMLNLTFVHLVVGFPPFLPARKRSQRLSDIIIGSVVGEIIGRPDS